MARTKNRYRLDITEDTQLQTYRAGIYVRLSKERSESWRNKSQSLENQESLAREFAKQQGLTVVKCYTDYEYSGTNFVRPAFQEMMDDIKKGSINCILIRDLSRLGRDYIEMGRLIDKVFPFLGVRFISINDHLDTLQGMEEKKSFEVEIKNLVNDMYSKDISKKVTAIHIQQASQGYFIGSFAPYGYKLDKQPLGIKLIVDPVVQPLLKKVFDQLENGYSINAVTKILNQNRIAVPTAYRQTGQLYRLPDDSREWKSSNLLKIIKNPVYLGCLIQRRTNKNLSDEDYIRVENTHEPYVSQQTSKTISSLIEQRKESRKSKIPKTPNRYHGLLYAKGKSTQMIRRCRHFSNRQSEYDYYYYTDYIYHHDKTKKQTVYISEKGLDQIILVFIKEEVRRLGSFDLLLSQLDRKKEDCKNRYKKQKTDYQKTLSGLRAELSELYAAYCLTRINREFYLSKKHEISLKIKTISEEITQCDYSVQQLLEEYQRQVTWLTYLSKYQNQEILTAELLNALIDRIEIDINKEVTITVSCQLGGCDA